MNMFYTKDALEFLRSIPDASVDLVFTDPPYNVSYKNSTYTDYRSKDGHSKISFDFGAWDYNYDPTEFLVEAKRVLNSHGSLIVWTSEQLFPVYSLWIRENMRYRNMLIYERTNPLPNFRKVGYRQCTELMIWATVGSIGKDNPNWIFSSQEGTKTVKRAPICGGKERRKTKEGKTHPTQKPLSICRDIVKMHCKLGGLIVDPYCGVGTIPLAAHLEGRNFLANDLNAEYIEIAEQRIKDEY